MAPTVFLHRGNIGAPLNDAHGRATFTSNDTFVVPTEVTTIYVTAIAAGGDGTEGAHNANQSVPGGDGGNCGDFLIGYPLQVHGNQTIPLTVGAGDTIIGTAITLGKGAGKYLGGKGSGDIPNRLQQAGGRGGYLNENGTDAEKLENGGSSYHSASGSGGGGAGSPFGKGGTGGYGAVAYHGSADKVRIAPTSPFGYGSGGGGGAGGDDYKPELSPTPGTKGAPGLIIIER